MEGEKKTNHKHLVLLGDICCPPCLHFAVSLGNNMHVCRMRLLQINHEKKTSLLITLFSVSCISYSFSLLTPYREDVLQRSSWTTSYIPKSMQI